MPNRIVQKVMLFWNDVFPSLGDPCMLLLGEGELALPYLETLVDLSPSSSNSSLSSIVLQWEILSQVTYKPSGLRHSNWMMLRNCIISVHAFLN